MEESIKLGECACCHNVRKVHRVWISYLRSAFLCDECDAPIQKSQTKEKVKEVEPTMVYPIKENHVYAVCQCCLPGCYGLDLGERQPGKHEYNFKCKRCGISGVVVS